MSLDGGGGTSQANPDQGGTSAAWAEDRAHGELNPALLGTVSQ